MESKELLLFCYFYQLLCGVFPLLKKGPHHRGISLKVNTTKHLVTSRQGFNYNMITTASPPGIHFYS